MTFPLERRTQRSSVKNKNLGTLEHKQTRSSAKTPEESTSARARKPVRSSVDFSLPELTPKSTTRSSARVPARAPPLERKETRSSVKITPAEVLQGHEKLGVCNIRSSATRPARAHQDPLERDDQKPGNKLSDQGSTHLFETSPTHPITQTNKIKG